MPQEPHYPGESEEYPEYEPEERDYEEEAVEESPKKEKHFPELESKLEKAKERRAEKKEARALKQEKKGLEREIRRTKYEPLYEAGGKIKEAGAELGGKIKEGGVELGGKIKEYGEEAGEKAGEALKKFRGTPEQRAERREKAKRAIKKFSSSLGGVASNLSKGIASQGRVMEARPPSIEEGVPAVSEGKNVLMEDYMMQEQPVDKISQLIPSNQPQPQSKMATLLPQGRQDQNLSFDIFGRGQQEPLTFGGGQKELLTFGGGQPATFEQRPPEDVLFARREMTAERPQRQIKRKAQAPVPVQEKSIESLISIGPKREGEIGLGGKGELLEFGSGRPIDLDLKPTQIGGGTDKVFGGFGGEEKPLNLGFGGGGNVFGGGGNEITKEGVIDFLGINKSQDIFSRPQAPPQVQPVRRAKKHKRRR